MKIKFKIDWLTHKAGNTGLFENNIGNHLIGLGVAELATSKPALKVDEPKEKKPPKQRVKKVK